MQKSSGYFKDEIVHGISLSLKYLQHLQAEANNLHVEGFGITKGNPHFQNLATYLDLAFSFGLSDERKGYWAFVKHFVHSATKELIENHTLATSENYKGQIWLFLSLLENTLVSYIELFVGSKKRLKESYKKFALLRDEECCEILKTLLHGLDSLEFALDIADPYLGYENEAIKACKDPPAAFLEANKDKAKLSHACENGHAEHDQSIPPIQDLEETEDTLVEHLSSGRKKRKPKKEEPKLNTQVSLTEDDGLSSIESIGLEDDHYIPELENSTPVTVSFVLPDDLLNASLSENPFVKDETIYKQFLLAYNSDKRSESPQQGEGSVDVASHPEDSEESTIDLIKEEETQDVDEIQDENGDEDEEDDNEVTPDLNAEGRGDGVYKITYVTDEEEEQGKDEGDEEDNHPIAHDERTRSVDSFDQFCRERTETKETDDKGDVSSADGDSDGEGDELEDSLFAQNGEQPEVCDGAMMDGREYKLMELSPYNIPKQSIDRVMNARMDTSIGILLPTLPRRPTLKDVSKFAHDFSSTQQTIVILSLEVFEEEGEQFGKMYHCFAGSLDGVHEGIEVVLSNRKVYILQSTDTNTNRFSKKLSFSYDSINKIQTGTNFQEVNILLDDGKYQIWTCDEIMTRNMIVSLKSAIKYGKFKTGEDEPIGQHINNDLSISLKGFLMSLEHTDDFELFYFGVVQFCCHVTEESGGKVIKSGHLLRKQSYLGVVGHWDQSLFSLRGHLLYEYAVKDGEVKQVLNLRNKCGGCARVKDKEKSFAFRIFSKDGVTSILELAADSEDDANDWIMSICLVMADVKTGTDTPMESGNEVMVPCGLAITGDSIYAFQRQFKNGKLKLLAMAPLQDVTRICVDNQERDYCTLLLDSDDGQYLQQKSRWILKFRSEFELGKFEQSIFACWHSIYQIPLQFVLFAEGPAKRNIRRILETMEKRKCNSVVDALRN